MHLDPSESHAFLKHQMLATARAALGNAEAAASLAGDFNFCAGGEGRLRVRDGTSTPTSPHLFNYFLGQFQGHAEIFQPDRARKTIRDDRVISAGGIDRIYVSTPSLILLD
eukprot:5273547-Pyramimonas_sp.AAC.1